MEHKYFGLTLGEIESVIAIISAIIISIAAVWRWVFVPSSKIVKNLNSIKNSIPVLQTIADEFKTNGGNSLRDAINRLERGGLERDLKMKVLMSKMSGAFFEADANGNYTWVSKNWSEITGILEHQALGNGWINSIVGDREAVYDEWQSALAQKRDFVMQYTVNSDLKTEVRNVSYVLKNFKGEVIGVLGLIQKI